MNELDLGSLFEAREYQVPFLRAMLVEGKDRAVCVDHRRSGKDFKALFLTLVKMHDRPGAYWHLFPTEAQGRKAIWEGFTEDGDRIMERAFPRSVRKSPKEFTLKQEMVVELKNGAVWRLVGTDRMELVGANPFGLVFSEYACANPLAWNLLRPIIRKNKGWAVFIFTPRGKNHGWELLQMAKGNPDWYSELQTINDTGGIITQADIDAERREGMPEPLVQQEYFCDFTVGNVGSVFADLIEAMDKRGALEEFEHPTDGIFTTFDLGITDSTAIWCWRVAEGGADFVDYYENRGKPMSHYFDLLDQWAEEKGYAYEKNLLPHDAKALNLQTGQSILEQCIDKWGADKVDLVPRLSLLDGIQAARWLMQRRGTRIHPRCDVHGGLRALRNYRYNYDERKKQFSALPLHDWTSHGSDGFRYSGVMSKLAYEAMKKDEAAPKKPVVSLSELPSLDEMWEDEETGRRGRRID